MSNLLAYGDKVVGVVARDNGSVSIMADGVKTYAQLFNELFAMVDRDKISKNSALLFQDTFLQISRFSATVISFLGLSDINLMTVALKSSSSLYYTYAITNSTATNRSTNVPTASMVIKIIY